MIVKLADSGFERHLNLHRAFRHFDADRNGKITLSEFGAALQVLRRPPSMQELLTLFRHFDPNGTGKGVSSAVTHSMVIEWGGGIRPYLLL